MTNLRNWAIEKATEIRSRDEEGQGLAEYGLILTLVALACIAALTGLGIAIAGQLDAITGNL